MEFVINTDKVIQQCMEVIHDKIKNLKTLNIMIIGKAGVGKSTLINSLFKGNFAKTGLGRPITSEIRKIEKKDYPLTIYDTPGLGLANKLQSMVKEEVLDIINKSFDSKDINDVIHCIWYCINVNGNRIDESEIKWLKELAAENKRTKVPVIVVLTQAIPKKKAAEMKHLVEKENLDIKKVVPVLAQDMDFDEEYIARAYGLDHLIDVMAEVLPSELQTTIQNVQKVSLESKKKAAQATVTAATVSAFGEGFAPIPLSDAALLVPTQVSMIASITVIFGLDINKSFLTSFVSATIGSAGATVLGKTIVSNLLKLIPGVGTLAGGVISGTTAGLLTTALGEAYIGIMEMIYKGEIGKETLYSKDGQQQMKYLFREQLKKKSRKTDA